MIYNQKQFRTRRAYPPQNIIRLASINEYVRQTIYSKYGEHFNCDLCKATAGFDTLESFIFTTDISKKIYLLLELNVLCFITVIADKETDEDVNSLNDIISLNKEDLDAQSLADIGCLFVSNEEVKDVLPFISGAQNKLGNRMMKMVGSTAYKLKRLEVKAEDELQKKILKEFTSVSLSILEGAYFLSNEVKEELNILDKMILMFLYRLDFPKSTKQVVSRFVHLSSLENIHRALNYLEKCGFTEKREIKVKSYRTIMGDVSTVFWVVKTKGVERLAVTYKYMMDAMLKNEEN